MNEDNGFGPSSFAYFWVQETTSLDELEGSATMMPGVHSEDRGHKACDSCPRPGVHAPKPTMVQDRPANLQQNLNVRVIRRLLQVHWVQGGWAPCSACLGNLYFQYIGDSLASLFNLLSGPPRVCKIMTQNPTTERQKALVLHACWGPARLCMRSSSCL